MILSDIIFTKSAAAPKDYPDDLGCEIAFAGRSNAGKSSALNSITNVQSLARTSKTPGRTQLINFFELSEMQRLVDLPGYGYAAVPKSVKASWQRNLKSYFAKRQSLKALVLLTDIRHPLKEYDKQMLELCEFRDPMLPVLILLTKADKLNRGPALNILQTVKSQLKEYHMDIKIQLFSALTKIGVAEAQKEIISILKS